MNDKLWTMTRGVGPLVATAIHDGHEVRAELRDWMVLDEANRLREEDPYTGVWTELAPNRVVALRSRFEMDLNRPRDLAVYRRPEDAWGLRVWRDGLPEALVRKSLSNYDGFYAALDDLYHGLSERHGRFVVLDLHSFNHRRQGPDGPPAPARHSPQINLGTATMLERSRWARLIDVFIESLVSYPFPTGALDVRENVNFFGGQCARWTHGRFPDSACVLSVEVKKFFMDEWSGRLDTRLHRALAEALAAAAAAMVRELERL